MIYSGLRNKYGNAGCGVTYKAEKAVLVDCEIFEKHLESFRILFVLRKILDISYYGKYNSM